MVKNPPALLERLRRSGHKLKLDEDGARDCLCLPYICFQKAVEPLDLRMPSASF